MLSIHFAHLLLIIFDRVMKFLPWKELWEDTSDMQEGHGYRING